MGCRQEHSDILTHVQPLTLTLLTLVSSKLRLWADVLLLQNFLTPPFVSTTLLPCYRWRGQRVYNGGFRCQKFLPTRAILEAFLKFTDRLYPSLPLGLLEWPAWNVIYLAIPSATFSVPVHLFLVSNRLQHPLQMHLPSIEIWGLPWQIHFMSLVHVKPPSAAFSSLKMPAL